jgi:Domain of unknown function (DUF4278)
MQLSYRGVHYENTPLSLEMKEGEIIGKYRGHEIHQKYPRHIPQIQPKFDLQYRGIPYSISAMPIERTRNFPLTQGDNCCSVPVKKQLKIEDNLTQIHLEYIKRNLERRIEVAKSKGDFNLVNLLQKEQLTLEC